MYVLRPLTKEELNSFFGKNEKIIINYFIRKSLFSQPERRIGQNKLPVQVPKEHIEQWLVQAMGIEGIGAGSYALDVINRENKWGADIKMLSAKIDKYGNLTNSDSGETSLAQKFKDTGDNLDTLFKENKFDLIKNEWLLIYKQKLESVKVENNLDKIFYFIMVRGGNKLYLLGMEVLLENLDNVFVDFDRTLKTSKSKEGPQSVFINGFLETNYGYTKIYKAKKRLELRLKPKKWVEDGLCLIFDLDVDTEEINLLDLLKEDNGFDINDYAKHKFKKLFG